ncbi:MAG: hypothetical protein DRO15_00340 [Thermoprotei archaeon]|nr:MAG: hypothetical protein DRO15_00340 [Thermoprotei archaeon]
MKVYCPELNLYVEIPEKPRKIVSISPAITEILFRLGLGNFVVGTSRWCIYPLEASSKPKVSDYLFIDINELKSLSPDLVLLSGSIQRPLAKYLLSNGFTVYLFPLPTSIVGIIDLVYSVGGIVGSFKESCTLAESLIRKLVRLNKALKKSLRIYVELDLGEPTIPCYFSHITSGIHLIGGYVVTSDIREAYVWGLKARELLREVPKLKPDVIIYEARSLKYDKDEIISKLCNRWSFINTNNVIILSAMSLSHYGPRFVDELNNLVNLLNNL